MNHSGVSQRLESIAEFNDAWPSGVAVSRAGRIFVSFPRAERVAHRGGEPPTLAEIRDGRAVAFPDEIVNDPGAGDAAHRFTSIQGIALAPGNRLFALDTGSQSLSGCDPEAVALYLIDLDHDAIVRRFTFARGVLTAKSYANDVVVDYNRGASGTAFISDSGAGGIIAVDLDTGRSWRRLDDHPSVRARCAEGFGIAAEGEVLQSAAGADGIALSPDGKLLWWTPLGSYDVFHAPTDALGDPSLPNDQVARTVESVGGRDFACDGLDADREGRIYFTDVTNNAIVRLVPSDMRYERIVQDDRLIWPDAVALGPDRILYVTSSQLNRSPHYQGGIDRRVPPFRLFRGASDADPASY